MSDLKADKLSNWLEEGGGPSERGLTLAPYDLNDEELAEGAAEIAIFGSKAACPLSARIAKKGRASVMCALTT